MVAENWPRAARRSERRICSCASCSAWVRSETRASQALVGEADAALGVHEEDPIIDRVQNLSQKTVSLGEGLGRERLLPFTVPELGDRLGQLSDELPFLEPLPLLRVEEGAGPKRERAEQRELQNIVQITAPGKAMPVDNRRQQHRERDREADDPGAEPPEGGNDDRQDQKREDGVAILDEERDPRGEQDEESDGEAGAETTRRRAVRRGRTVRARTRVGPASTELHRKVEGSASAIGRGNSGSRLRHYCRRRRPEQTAGAIIHDFG